MLPPDLVAKLNGCTKTDFGAVRDLWFSRFSISTDFVVAGLALEVFELVFEATEIANDNLGFLKNRIAIPKGAVHLAKLVAFLGWFLIVGGVIGERLSEARVKDADVSIQQCSDAKVRETTIESGDAQASANGARGAAKDAQAQASRARDKADVAKTAAGTAKHEADDVGRKAEQLRADLAEEDDDAKKLQGLVNKLANFAVERANDRRFGLNIRDEVKKMPPATVRISYPETNDESGRTARNLWWELGDYIPGWDVGDGPEPLNEKQFTEEAFACEGAKIFNKQVEFVTGPSITRLETISVAKQQGLNEEQATKLAILVVGLHAEEVVKDPTLPGNFFKVIVCPRAAVQGNPLR